jgi:mannose-6-phosphate isomerase-like protein (cupin superfamily)
MSNITEYTIERRAGETVDRVTYVVEYNPNDADTRPWGSYKVIDIGHLGSDQGGLVCCYKEIVVNPGQVLSVQEHEFRQEDWQIQAGKCVISLGDNPDTMKEYERIAKGKVFIPVGVWHTVKNTGDEPLIIHERQSGVYLAEYDIGRAPTPTDPRTTNKVERQRVRDEVTKRGIQIPKTMLAARNNYHQRNMFERLHSALGHAVVRACPQLI